MAMISLRRNRENPDQVLARTQELADHVDSEHRALEDLIVRARLSATELSRLTEPIAEMSERLTLFEKRLMHVGEVAARVAEVQDRTVGLDQTQRRMETQLTESVASAARLQSQVDEVRPLLESALHLEEDLKKFLELEGPFKALKGEAGTLKAKVGEVTDDCGRLRKRQDDLSTASKNASSRLETLEKAGEAATRTVEGAQSRVRELEQEIGRLTQLAAAVSDTKHQLLTLKSLADQVAQKTAALDKLHGAVERAGKDMSRLDELARKADAAMRSHDDQVHRLHKMASEVEDLKSLYESVSARSEEISARQQQIDEHERATRQKFTDLGEQVRKASERSELEYRGLEIMSHRIAELREALKDDETRMATLEASSGAVTVLRAEADTLGTQLGALTEEVGKTREQAEHLRGLRTDADRLDERLKDVSARVVRVEEAKPTVEAVLGDLATLNRTHESIRDALEQANAAHAETKEMRETQVNTTAWLKSVQETVADLQSRVRQLNALKPTVESVQKDMERVAGTMEEVTSRRHIVDEVQGRLTELGSLADQLDDRTKTLRMRIDIAEGRFLSVTKQAEETDRIGKLVTGVAQTVADAEGRIGDVMRSISSIEGRSENLERVAEQARVLGGELEQRHGALDKASERMEQASALRLEAADAVQRLDERIRALQTLLDTVEGRVLELDVMSDDLESRSSKLGFVEKRMGQFERQLAKWEQVEGELERALEQVAARQATVDALRADLKHMFELAERTAGDVGVIAEAQKEIQGSKASLQELLRRLHETDVSMAGLEERQRQIEQAEQRLARADALLIDIHASLEALHSQKAIVDHVIEKIGSLTLEAQQAETLIDRLREERDITNRARASLEDLRRHVFAAKGG
jgi:DNA repair exonuclease SbcCD ATPase subunit